MKTIILVGLLLSATFGFSQNKIYTITEQFTAGGNTSMDKIIVTDPEGNTTEYNITHFLDDVKAHDSEFNKILNDVIKKGYKLFVSSPPGHGDLKNMKSVFTRTWFLEEAN